MPATKSLTGLRIVDALIAAFWIYLLFDAYYEGRELPLLIEEVERELTEIPLALALASFLVLAVAGALLAFWQRRRIMEDMPLVSSALDRVFGTGAYKRFMYRLHPLWASVLSSLLLAIVGLHATFRSNQSELSYAVCIGFIGFSVSMVVAYLFSRRYPPVLQ